MAIAPPPKTTKGNPRPVVRIDEEKQMALGGVLHTHVAPGQLTGILVALKVMFSWGLYRALFLVYMWLFCVGIVLFFVYMWLFCVGIGFFCVGIGLFCVGIGHTFSVWVFSVRVSPPF